MTGPRRGSLMVPMGEEPATLALILESLRALDKRLDSQNAAATEDRKMLHDVHTRIIQIESNQLQRRVEDLTKKVDELNRDRDRRDGALRAGEWFFRNWPAVIGYILLAVGMLWSTGKIGVH